MMAQRLISVILTAFLVLPSLYSPTSLMGADAHSKTSISPDPVGWGTDEVSFSSVTLSPPKGSGPSQTPTVSRGMYGESCPLAVTDLGANLVSATPSCAPLSTTFHIQELYGDLGIDIGGVNGAHGQACPGECDVKLSDGGGRIVAAGTSGQGYLYPTLCIAPNHSKWIYWSGGCPLPPHNFVQPSSRGMYGEECPPAQTGVADNPAGATPSCAPAGTTFHVQELNGDHYIHIHIPGKFDGRDCQGECDVALTDGGGSVAVDGPTQQGYLYPKLCIAPNHSKWIYWSGGCPKSSPTPTTQTVVVFVHGIMGDYTRMSGSLSDTQGNDYPNLLTAIRVKGYPIYPFAYYQEGRL